MSVRDFIAALPKAELHVHQVGSASPRIVAELAARHGDTPVPPDTDELAGYFAFSDFAHFIEIYLSVVDLVRTADDVRMLTYEVGPRHGRPADPVRRANLHAVPFAGASRALAKRSDGEHAIAITTSDLWAGPRIFGEGWRSVR